MDTQIINVKKMSKQKWIILISIIILLGGLIIFAMTKEFEEEESEQPPKIAVVAENTSVPKDTSNAVTVSTNQTRLYKQGTFQATGNYVAPGGKESIDISVDLKDDVVTNVKVVVQAKNPTSINWQNYFVQAVNPAVAGMKLDAIRIDTVSGSSLTQIGFMDALEKIKAQAKM
jgi:uncharacterized protein with FMN-binding domain